MRLINLEQILLGATIAFMGWQYYGNTNWVVLGSIIIIIGLLFGPYNGDANRPFRSTGIEYHRSGLAYAGVASY